MSKAIILVAFGSTNLEGIKGSIVLLENDFRQAFGKEYTVIKAFTSKFIVNKIKEKYNIYIPHITNALFDLRNDGYTEVIIQPLHMMAGKDICELEAIIEEYSYSFKKIKLGKTLFEIESDNLKKGVSKLLEVLLEENLKSENILLAGHGSKISSDNFYIELQMSLNNSSNKKFYLATLEGKYKIEDVVRDLQHNNVKDVSIRPLFIIPGKHVLEDIAGENNSWLEIIQNLGINCNIVKKSLLQNYKIREIFIKNIKDVIC